MKYLDTKLISEIIDYKIPQSNVVTEHTNKGHFYRIVDKDVVYGSVTTKLQMLKDESLINYKMNRALDYVADHWHLFTEQNIKTQLDEASKVSAGILEDAGDIGTLIHNCREAYFKDWIKNGRRPDRIFDYMPKDRYDLRCVSALRALEKFVGDTKYIPLRTELKVWSHDMKVAGTLDDIGVMYNQLVLMDLKSSNAIKDLYYPQVAMYYEMFKKLTGIRPKRCFILRVSKEDGTYKIEDLFDMPKLVRYAKNILKVSDGIEFIKSLRKDNQKVVVKL